jgi:hypothetical protein
MFILRNPLSRARLRATRQKVLFGAILSSYTVAMLATALKFSYNCANLRRLSDILATQDMYAGVYALPDFLVIICSAYNVRIDDAIVLLL